jgi:nitrite reductase (NO-forming)
MNRLKTLLTILAVVGGVVLPLAAFALRPGGAGEIERIDFGVVRTTVEPAFDARIRPASEAPVKEFRIPITHDVIEIADGETYAGWTFGGTIPGPALHVRQGDLVRIVLVNESAMGHSIDLHSARIPMNEAFRTIPPGGELSFEFEARDPGVYLVHCGTPPVLMHIMQGMYLAIVVDPEGGWGTDADKEFVIVQSEFYAREGEDDGEAAQPDWEAALDARPSQVVFNGRAFQYKKTPLEVGVGDRVRFFVANAGPNLRSDFHVVGTVFDRVILDGKPEHALEHVQTWTVPAGGGAVFETVFEEGSSGEGMYAFVTHAFADAEKGAVGLIQVGQPELAAGVGH